MTEGAEQEKGSEADTPAAQDSPGLRDRPLSIDPRIGEVDGNLFGPSSFKSPEDAKDETIWEEVDEADEFEIWPPSFDPDALAESSPWRLAIAFAIITMLLALFCLIAFWGLTHSSWWY